MQKAAPTKSAATKPAATKPAATKPVAVNKIEIANEESKEPVPSQKPFVTEAEKKVL